MSNTVDGGTLRPVDVDVGRLGELLGRWGAENGFLVERGIGGAEIAEAAGLNSISVGKTLGWAGYKRVAESTWNLTPPATS